MTKTVPDFPHGEPTPSLKLMNKLKPSSVNPSNNSGGNDQEMAKELSPQ